MTGSEAAGQYADRGRRSEPRNHRGDHRGLGHYHFGDSDSATDLDRPHTARRSACGTTANACRNRDDCRAGSGLHCSPSHRSPSNALDQHLSSPTRRMVTPARRVGSSWRSRERPARHRSGAGSSPGRTNRLHAECPPRHRNESRPDRKSLGYGSAGRPFIGHQPKRTDVSPRHR
jgi:hypothetical protein